MRVVSAFAIASLWLVAGLSRAGVFDLTVSDVTTRAFSVVWASDQPVVDASVRVFADAAGTVEISGDLSTSLVSQSDAFALGLVSVDVTGLQRESTVFVQVESVDSGGTTLFPTSPPFLEVTMATRTTKASALEELIVNDLIHYEAFGLAGSGAVGTLVVLDIPGATMSPVTGFVGAQLAEPFAVVDLANLFDASTGESLEVRPGQVMTMTEFRGGLCAGLADHKLLRFRRVPDHEEVAAVGVPVTQLETPPECFFANVVCDDVIDIEDVQRVVNAFSRAIGDCAFNPDLDIVSDGLIDIEDIQLVVNRFGETAPFNP